MSLSSTVTSTVNLEYKYVPSINELINKQTFIPSDPDLYKIKREDKKMRGNKVVPGKGLPKGPDPLISLGSKDLSIDQKLNQHLKS